MRIQNGGYHRIKGMAKIRTFPFLGPDNKVVFQDPVLHDSTWDGVELTRFCGYFISWEREGGCPSCRNRMPRIRRISGNRWWNSYEPKPGGAGQGIRAVRADDPQLGDAGRTRGSGAPRWAQPRSSRICGAFAGRTSNCVSNGTFWQKPRLGSLARPTRNSGPSTSS